MADPLENGIFSSLSAILKRLISILFLFILLLNLYGYRLVIQYMVSRQDARMETKLEQKDFKFSDLISIKSKLDLPYYNGSTNGFERAYGSVMVNGMEYQFVMRRVYLDSMELLCLPHTAKMQIESVGKQLDKLSFSDQPSQTNKKAGVIKISLPDFFQEDISSAFIFLTRNQPIRPSFILKCLPSKHSLRQEQPPEPMSDIS